MHTSTLIDRVFNKFGKNAVMRRSSRKAVSVGVSMPTDILHTIDECRGDVTRSRFVLRILEKASVQLMRGKATEKGGDDVR
jgi:hypothetical protein